MCLYGVHPFDGDTESGLEPRQVLSMKARIEYVKEVAKGDSITYFGTFTAPAPMRIGTLHIGFRDALPRERALRSCVYAAEEGRADAFVQALMRGYWFEKKDISDITVLQRMADAAGLGPRRVAEIVGDERYKAAVCANTDDAVACGVFGVPSFLFDGKLFFGSDRMDLLDAAVGAWTG